MNSLDQTLLSFTEDWRNPVGLAVLACIVFVSFLYWEQTRLVLKSMTRNLQRTALTAMATFFLVLGVTVIWSILAFLDKQTETKSQNLKAIVTEKYQIPSQMPYSYAASLAEGAPRKPGDYRVNADKDAMLWAFYGGTIDPEKRTRESIVFFFVMEPRKLASFDARGRFQTMMEDADDFSEHDKRRVAAACREMEQYPFKVLIGPSRLAALNKKVGEKIKVTSLNYSGIDLEFEILGELPGGRYEQMAVMNYAYLDQALDKYKRENKAEHAMAQRTLALMWLRVPDTRTFEKVAEQVTSSPDYKSPAVKCETASSAIANFLDAYKDLLFGMRWLLVPAILVTMSLVVAIAISISVRERRVELAVLKVLGFSPNQILVLVLGEALLISCVTGLFSALVTQHAVNEILGGIALPIAFFGKFYVADAAPWWGLGISGVTALAGSLLPAWSARSVKVSEVFSKIT